MAAKEWLNCRYCDTPMSEIYRDKKKDVYFWRCNKCLKTVNIRGSTCIPKSIY